MQLHELQPITKRPSKKRIGRGGKKGTTSGRGTKGQKSRAGHRLAPVIREVIKRYPKLKGYRGVKRHRKPQTVSLSVLAKAFKAGETISPLTLAEKDLVKKLRSKRFPVKIIGTAELKEALRVEGCQITPKAKAAIESAGGTIV